MKMKKQKQNILLEQDAEWLKKKTEKSKVN